jgi:hypothetical protein
MIEKTNFLVSNNYHIAEGLTAYKRGFAQFLVEAKQVFLKGNTFGLVDGELCTVGNTPFTNTIYIRLK